MKLDRIFALRVVLYLVGLFFLATTICFMTRANIGIGPIGAVAYISSRISGQTIGVTQLIINLLFILVQIIWLGKTFEKFQYFQVLSSVIFSIFINLIMAATVSLDYTNLSLFMRFVVLIISIVCAAVGVSCLKIIRMAMLPADGLAYAISLKIKWPFGKVRVFLDCCWVSLTVIVSLAAFKKVEGINIGTVLSALLTGNITRFILFMTEKRLSPMFAPKPQPETSG